MVGETARAPGVKRGWLQDFFPIKSAHGTVAGVGVMVREIAVPLASQAGGKQAFATPEHLLESGKECFRMVRAEDANAVGLDRLGHRLRTRAVKRLAQIHKMRRAAGR